MATGAAGQASQEAYQDGAGFYQGQAYGALRGATEAATEYALGGTTKLITGGGRAMLPAVRKSVASTGVKRVAKAALEDGLEEMISEGLDPLTRTTYKGKEALEEYRDPAFYKRVLEAGKDGTLTGLVFQGTVGHAMGNTGKAADIQEIKSELDTLKEKKRNLGKNNKLTDEAYAAIGEAERENWRVMETVLKKATPEKRATLMEDYGLSGRFSEDGSMKADFAAELDRKATVGRMAAEGENGVPAGSAGQYAGFDRRTASVDAEAEQVAAVLAKEGRTQFTDVDGLSKEARKNLRDLKRVTDVFYDISDGAVGNFVIANESVTDNAYYDPETGYIVIGADALENGINMTRKGVQSWFQTALHEATHGTEGTTPSSALARKLESLTVKTETGELNLGELAIQELIDRGYFGDDAEAAQARIEELLSMEGEIRAIFEDSGVDNRGEVQYNRKGKLNISKKEYAVLAADVAALIAHRVSQGKDIPNYYYGRTYDYFYVYEYYGNNEFKVLKRFPYTDKNQQYIRWLEGRLQDGIQTVTGTGNLLRMLDDLRREYRRNHGNNVVDSRGLADSGNGGLSVEKQGGDGGRDHRGSHSDQRDGGVKKSGKPSFSSDDSAMEQMRRDIADLEKLNSERAAIMVEQFLGNAHFARVLLDADASLVEKLLNRIADAKEALARKKDPEAKKVFEELRAAEGAFLDALAQKGMRFEKGKIIGAGEEERQKSVQYSIKRPQFTQNDIKKNMEVIASMDAVATIGVEKLERTGKRPKDIYLEFFDGLGNQITSPIYGDIALSNSSAKSEIRHGNTAQKIASIEAIPTVIEKGEVIFHRSKQDSDVERIVICAPIKIGTEDYYMGVMLQRDTQSQRLYLHSVVSLATKEEATTSSQADRVTNGALEDDDHLFMTSILQKAVNVKRILEKSSVKKSRKANPQTSGKNIDPAKRKAMANLTHQKVYNKADAANMVDSFIVEDR